MVMRQMVEIPSSRRLTLEIPPEIPVGRGILTFTPETEPAAKTLCKEDAPGTPSLLDLRGSCKGIDTLDAYFERKRADKVLEDARERI